MYKTTVTFREGLDQEIITSVKAKVEIEGDNFISVNVGKDQKYFVNNNDVKSITLNVIVENEEKFAYDQKEAIKFIQYKLSKTTSAGLFDGTVKEILDANEDYAHSKKIIAD